MKAPRLPSPFRNVRQAPRSFTFRSSHVDGRAMRWKERRDALEAEVEGAGDDAPRKLRFRQFAGPGLDRVTRIQATRSARRRAMLRSFAILLVLLYAAWRGLLWVETTDFAREYLLPPGP
jgi:hypothetical protein